MLTQMDDMLRIADPGFACQVPLNIFVVIGTKLTDVYPHWPQLSLKADQFQTNFFHVHPPLC